MTKRASASESLPLCVFGPGGDFRTAWLPGPSCSTAAARPGRAAACSARPAVRAAQRPLTRRRGRGLLRIRLGADEGYAGGGQQTRAGVPVVTSGRPPEAPPRTALADLGHPTSEHTDGQSKPAT